MNKTIVVLSNIVAIGIIGSFGLVENVFADHAEVTITPVPGSSTAGCQDTPEGCYDPLVATVDVGGKVIFSNTDTVAHVFAAGTIQEPTGEFDSGLVNPGASYEWTPTKVGTVEHFCTVHPWQSGTIIVQSSGTNITNPPLPSPPPPEPTKVIDNTIPINFDGVDYLIEYTTVNMDVYDMYIEKSYNSLILDVDVFDDVGMLDIAIERALLDSVIDGEDVEYIVIIDGTLEGDVRELSSNEQLRTLSITVPSGSVNVEIIGTVLASDNTESVNTTQIEPIPPEPSVSKKTDVKSTNHNEVTITPVPGSSTAGCQDTPEGCYDPMVAYIDIGGKVIFSNTDTVAHVFAAGTIQEPTGEFDSGLVNPGASYEWTPTKVGTVEHFCTVHPWQSGTIIVQSSGTNITNPPPPSTPPPEPTNEEIIEQLETKVDRKTETKNMWKERFNICKDNKSTIKSELSDLQSEHLTLETKYNEAFFTIEKLKQELYEAQKRIEELESN